MLYSALLSKALPLIASPPLALTSTLWDSANLPEKDATLRDVFLCGCTLDLHGFRCQFNLYHLLLLPNGIDAVHVDGHAGIELGGAQKGKTHRLPQQPSVHVLALPE